MQPVRGILLDIDGVLHVSMEPIVGAADTLMWLERQEYKTYFVSNTTTMARATLADRLQAIGLLVTKQHLITAPVAAAAYIRQNFPGKRCWLLTKGDTERDFESIELVTTNADVIVIGGAEELLSYETMNAAFRMLMDGATLLAMHTNLYWRTKDGLQLDSGPFVRALEVATGKQAVVVGKPEQTFFHQALRAIDCRADETIMAGDDILNDVDGAQKAGMRALFVASGKHRADSPLLKQIRPTAILSSVAELPDWLKAQGH